MTLRPLSQSPAPLAVLASATVLMVATLAAGLASFESRPPAAESVDPNSEPTARRRANLLEDVGWDDGTAVEVSLFELRQTVLANGETVDGVESVEVWTSAGENALFARRKTIRLDEPLGFQPPVVVDGLPPGVVSRFLFRGLDADGDVVFERSKESIRPEAAALNWSRGWLFLLMAFVCGSIVVWIVAARRGREVWVRRIPALDAVDEAVGRATEMGKPCLFVPGILDMNDIQTIAGLTLLGHVAERSADYRSSLEVPTSKSLVMTAARESVESAYLTAGRGESFNPDSISYVTDEQFGYVAYLSGWMVREEPAACFYLGAFFAESLILAETGNAVGAVQMAGTAEPSQLPFFVAACDYTLIGEEFFAASAYLSGDPDQLGSLKGQDVAKLLAVALIVVGTAAATLDAVGVPGFGAVAGFLTDRVLSGT